VTLHPHLSEGVFSGSWIDSYAFFCGGNVASNFVFGAVDQAGFAACAQALIKALAKLGCNGALGES